ncbi:rod-binding protein [Bartonella sp. WD12.1]|uniref:rod-binding protein n=1 Tax=Bartonella sp. WD12.1 TaxID=1933903 RepID=UPI00099A3149|nr:rod-binding protein [Bartonella sp. WD12.1]OPB30132.1 Rod binding protein [Bartonella sp. WD12.1]
MAIQPPSDIVLDVARAADPVEYRASVEKLRDLHTTARTQTAANQENNFAQLVHADYTNSHNVTQHELQQVHLKPHSVENKNTEVFKNFEAFILQTFVENMFTTEMQSIFGKGQAGQIWKFMMAEQLAKEFATSGGIGIAQMLISEQAKKEEGSYNGEGNKINATH